MLVLSNAHHRKWPGAVNREIQMSEYIYSCEINRRILNLFVNDDLEEKVYILDTSWLSSYKESLRKKVEIINKLRPTIAIENHLNSVSDPEVLGCETLYFEGSIKGEKLADFVQTSILTIPEININRGIKARSDLLFLKGTTCTSIITEPLFLSNRSSNLILNENFMDKLAKMIFNGIKNYLDFINN